MSRFARLTATTLLLAASPAAAQEFGEPYSGAPRASQAYAAAIQEARAAVRTFMERRGIPGLSIAVAVHGNIVWAEGFGYANVEHRVPVTTITKFRSGSIAKPITGAGLAVLYEQGRIDLDAPIQKYVPGFPKDGGKDRITLRILGGHQSGIRHYPPDGDEFFSTKRYTNITDGLDIFKNDPLLFQPGTKYSYSTYGTNLVGMAVQAAAGKDFLSHLHDAVFEPLGMRSTVGDHSDTLIAYRTSYYERTNQPKHYHLRKSSWGDGSTPGVLLNAPFADNSNKHPGGGFLTTPEDLVRFGSAQLKPGFLKAETLKLLHTAQKTSDGKATTYGINWNINTDDKGRKTVSHGGGSVGGTSHLVLYPEQGVVLAVQCNLTNANYGDLPGRIAELFLARVTAANSGR